jgi:hypothetical protein
MSVDIAINSVRREELARVVLEWNRLVGSLIRFREDGWDDTIAAHQVKQTNLDKPQSQGVYKSRVARLLCFALL